MMAEDNHSPVPGLERGLNILRLFKRSRGVISPPEMARELGIPRSTVHRLVTTLTEMGFLRRVENGGAYALGPAVLTIGFDYLGSLDIVALAGPVLARLRDETGCSTHLGVRNGTEVVYLARHATRGAVTSNVGIGSALPAYATAIGRVILADLPAEELHALYGGAALVRHTEQTPGTLAELEEILAEDRRRGYAASMSAFERGVVAVAAPVHDHSGKAIAGINATAFDPAVDGERLHGALKDQVCAAAAEISAMLGAPSPATDAMLHRRFGT